MREIKFRAWDINDKKWHTRVHVGTNCGHAIYDEEREQWFEFDEFCGTVVQWTGLQDRNGKDIYEGDVVSFTDGLDEGSDLPERIGVVGFSDASFRIEKNFTNHYRWMDYNCEIIGNIYENQELLGEEPK